MKVVIRKAGMVTQRMVWLYGLTTILCLICLQGCGKDAPKEARDQETLQEVSLVYWTDRLVERDYQAAYDREIDSANMPFETYRGLVSRNENFAFSGLSIENVSLEENQGMVHVHLNCLIPGLPEAIGRTFKDQWVYESDRWKHQFSERQP